MKNFKNQIFDFLFQKTLLFEIFDFSKSRNFHRKNEIFLNFFSFYCFIISHVYPQLVAPQNSHCAARGRGKRPRRKSENPENPYFWRFWGHFSLINHIGFSLKYVAPKSSTDFFHRKKKFSTKFFIFSFFIISHAQPMQVASRNSPWARRTGRYEKKCPFFPLNPVWGPSTSWILCTVNKGELNQRKNSNYKVCIIADWPGIRSYVILIC